MNLHQAVARYRTLVLEGCEGLDRDGLLVSLAHQGFLVRHTPGTLHHVDSTQPFRELLALPGRLAVDGSIIRELVYGPLRRGHSRVTWIQALDFADALAERDGALLHVTRPPPSPSPHRPPEHGATDPERAEAHEACAAYDRALRTLAQHVPVVTVYPVDRPPDGARPVG